jgi:hypothetical protein
MPHGSEPLSGDGSGTNSSIMKKAQKVLRGNSLPPSEPLDLFDKQVIISIIVVFLFLFVWLLGMGIQPPAYAFWTFTALLTLIFVGFLRATGVLRTSWGALGGSVAVYAGLLLLTQNTFDSQSGLTHETQKLRDQIKSLQLKQADPAKDALEHYFIFLRQRNFKEAYDLISDAKKSERVRDLPSGVDDYSYYVTQFENTRGYRYLTFDLREESEDQRTYRMTMDVLDNVPHNLLFERLRDKVSALSGSVDRNGLFDTIVANIKEYYDFPDSAMPAIQEYVKARTVNELLDPTFIGELVIYMRPRGIVFEQKLTHPENAPVWRYFRYDNAVMINQNGTEWKVRSVNNPVIAVYQ